MPVAPNSPAPFLIAAAVLLIGSTPAASSFAADQWAPAKGPLMTR